MENLNAFKIKNTFKFHFSDHSLLRESDAHDSLPKLSASVGRLWVGISKRQQPIRRREASNNQSPIINNQSISPILLIMSLSLIILHLSVLVSTFKYFSIIYSSLLINLPTHGFLPPTLPFLHLFTPLFWVVLPTFILFLQLSLILSLILQFKW